MLIQTRARIALKLLELRFMDGWPLEDASLAQAFADRMEQSRDFCVAGAASARAIRQKFATAVLPRFQELSPWALTHLLSLQTSDAQLHIYTQLSDIYSLD